MAATDEHAKLPLLELTPPPSVLLVVAPYYRAIANDLIAGAKGVLASVNARVDHIDVPGALEIPSAIKLARKHYEGFVALGCVIRGETTHYETVCNDSARGLMLLGLDEICIGNGILTCETMDQARVRAAPAEQDKGGGAAAAALHLIALARKFRIKDQSSPPHGTVDDDPEDIILAGGTGLTRTA